jgi:hypothetical protein
LLICKFFGMLDPTIPDNSKNIEGNYYSYNLFNMLILLLLHQLVNVFYQWLNITLQQNILKIKPNQRYITTKPHNHKIGIKKYNKKNLQSWINILTGLEAIDFQLSKLFYVLTLEFVPFMEIIFSPNLNMLVGFQLPLLTLFNFVY